MSSTTIKRSVATLGVVAGLLAAAVPASAAHVPNDFAGAVLNVTAPEPSDEGQTQSRKPAPVL